MCQSEAIISPMISVSDFVLVERLLRKTKIEKGRACYRSEDRNEKIWLVGDLTIGDREVPLASITKIIEARVTEVFQIIKKELKEANLFNADDIAVGVILTGGTSRFGKFRSSSQ